MRRLRKSIPQFLKESKVRCQVFVQENVTFTTRGQPVFLHEVCSIFLTNLALPEQGFAKRFWQPAEAPFQRGHSGVDATGLRGGRARPIAQDLSGDTWGIAWSLSLVFEAPHFLRRIRHAFAAAGAGVPPQIATVRSLVSN